MKSKTRKVISLLIVFTLFFSYATSTMAINNDDYKLSNVIYVEKNQMGQYVNSSNKDIIKSLQNSKIEAVMEEELGVYKLPNGELISYTGSDCYQKVEKISFKLTDITAIELALSKINMPSEIKEKIWLDSDEAIRNNNHEARMSVVYPPEPPEVSILGQSTVDYTYNGKPMRDITIFSFDKDTLWKPIKEGTGVKSLTGGLKNITITAAGLTEGILVPLVAAGISLLQAFTDYVDETNFSASSTDELQMRWKYDVSTKYTYVDFGSGWEIGLVSENIYLQWIKSLQYYSDSTYNETYETENIIKSTKSSPNFYNPAPIAYYNTSTPINEELTTSIGDYTLHY